MKAISSLAILLIIGITCSTFAQSTEKPSTIAEKTNQASRFNELYGGYGAGSIFYFTGRMNHTDGYVTEMYSYENGSLNNKTFTTPSSSGTFFLGYGRSLNEVISMGFLFGFQNFSYTGKAHYVNSISGVDSVVHITNNDYLLSGIARVLFSYVNKPAIRLYSGIGIGITVDFGKGKLGEDEYSEHRLWPAGQLTLMGLRFGRAFGGFFEFGFGSYGIINAGISYKFKD